MHSKNIFMGVIDMLLPPRCPVTGDIVSFQGMLSPNAWEKLDFIANPLCSCCGTPLAFEVYENEKCLTCLDNVPIFKTARSPFIYGDVIRDLILGFKHGDKTHFVSAFVPFLTSAGDEMLKKADYLVPVPLHPTRLIYRRYNQSALISSALSKSIGIPDLPLALKRVRSTPSQGHLSTGERIKNVQKAFEVSEKYHSLLKDKSVVIIDDVYTTGATVKECSKVLLKHGVKEINILTIARVVHSD